MVGGPQASMLRDMPVTADSIRMATYAHRIETIWRGTSNWASSLISVMEIGGGFGGFAYALTKRMPILEYILIDDAACLEIQRRFLRSALSRELFSACRFISREDAMEFNGKIHLVVNTHSFGEMTVSEVAKYFKLIERVLVAGGAFYTVNRLDRDVSFREYPYDALWKHIVVSPLESKMIECISVRDPSGRSQHPVNRLN